MTTVAYCGFTDTGNIGDYAVLHAAQLLFHGITLESSAACRDDCNVNLFGGGTLLPYCLRYRWYPRRDIYLAIGVGVADPSFYGEYSWLTRRSIRKQRFRFLGVRGPLSQCILKQYGVESVVTGDTALAFRPTETCKPASETVALAVVGEPMRRFGSCEAVRNAARDFGLRIASDGARLKLIPFCKSDKVVMERLYDDLGGRAELVDFWSPPIDCQLDLFLDEIQQCAIVVGERLHAAVLAAAMHRPFVSLAYKPKCLDFAASLNVDVRVQMPSDRVTGKLLHERVLQLWRNGEEVSASLRSSVEELRSNLASAANEMRSVICEHTAKASC